MPRHSHSSPSVSAPVAARSSLGQETHDRLITRLVQADCSPAQLAEELGLTLSQLALWAADPRHMMVLAHLSRLADVRAQLLLSHYRANAAAQLIQIAASPDASELSRKACVDLLGVNLDPFATSSSHHNHADAIADGGADEGAILAALEQIGAEISQRSAP